MGYYRSSFKLGWIANVTLTALLYLLATQEFALGQSALPLQVSVGAQVVDVPRWLAALAGAALAMFVLNQVRTSRCVL
jgi:hypothetical protein